jgi:hypothetical protein
MSDAFRPGVAAAEAATGAPGVLQPYAEGAAGIRFSVSEICTKARQGRNDWRVKKWANACLKAAGLDGRGAPSVFSKATCLLDNIRKKTIWVPDPIGTEMIQSAAATLCLDATLCMQGGDCDDLVGGTMAVMMAVGIPTQLVKQRLVYNQQEHVLAAVQDEGGKWLYVDPSFSTPVGECQPFRDEVWIDPMSQGSAEVGGSSSGAEYVGVGAGHPPHLRRSLLRWNKGKWWRLVSATGTRSFPAGPVHETLVLLTPAELDLLSLTNAPSLVPGMAQGPGGAGRGGGHGGGGGGGGGGHSWGGGGGGGHGGGGGFHPHAAPAHVGGAPAPTRGSPHGHGGPSPAHVSAPASGGTPPHRTPAAPLAHHGAGAHAHHAGPHEHGHFRHHHFRQFHHGFWWDWSYPWGWIVVQGASCGEWGDPLVNPPGWLVDDAANELARSGDNPVSKTVSTGALYLYTREAGAIVIRPCIGYANTVGLGQTERVAGGRYGVGSGPAGLGATVPQGNWVVQADMTIVQGLRYVVIFAAGARFDPLHVPAARAWEMGDAKEYWAPSFFLESLVEDKAGSLTDYTTSWILQGIARQSGQLSPTGPQPGAPFAAHVSVALVYKEAGGGLATPPAPAPGSASASANGGDTGVSLGTAIGIGALGAGVLAAGYGVYRYTQQKRRRAA